MAKSGRVALLGLAISFAVSAADVQGLIVDWDCAKPIVRDGREKTLKNNAKCSLGNNYSRPGYGLITSDNKIYKLDDAGRAWALRLLKDTPDKDNLKVVTSGDIEGDTIHVKNMSEL